MASNKVQRANPQPKGPLVVEMNYIRDQKALQEARYINDFLQWAALGNFAENQARSTDWLNLQFWLYFAESLIAIEEVEGEPELRIEFGIVISDAFSALYAAGRRFKESGNTVMRMSPMEVNMVGQALALGEAYREGVDDNTLKGIARYVNKHINNGK